MCFLQVYTILSSCLKFENDAYAYLIICSFEMYKCILNAQVCFHFYFRNIMLKFQTFIFLRAIFEMFIFLKNKFIYSFLFYN